MLNKFVDNVFSFFPRNDKNFFPFLAENSGLLLMWKQNNGRHNETDNPLAVYMTYNVKSLKAKTL